VAGRLGSVLGAAAEAERGSRAARLGFRGPSANRSHHG